MGMHWNKKKRWAGVAAAALLLTGGVGFGPTRVGAITMASSIDFVSRVPAGYLDLQLRTSATGVVSGQVFQYSAATPPVVVATQSFSITRCEVTGTTGPELLSINSSVGRLGIYNNGLGSKTKNNCTPAEGRTEVAETLTVALGSALGSSPLKIDFAQLDIEGKFSAELHWTLNATPTPATGWASLATSNDNGPDAGTGDNTMVTVGAQGNPADDFTSMVLSTPVGEFALDGGGDGTYLTQNLASNNDSVFFLTSSTTYGYTVNCGEAASATSDELGLADTPNQVDSTVQEVTYVRMPNKNQAACPTTPDPGASIGVTVSANDVSGHDEVYVDNSTTSATGVPQSVRARVRIVWVVQIGSRSQDDLNAELSRQILYDPLVGLVDVKNCRIVPSATANDPLNPDVVEQITHPTGVPWCLMSDKRVVEGNTIVQTQIYSGNGDPRFL